MIVGETAYPLFLGLGLGLGVADIRDTHRLFYETSPKTR
jgi:hypothetical protein